MTETPNPQTPATPPAAAPAQPAQAAQPAGKPTITYDDFAKLDLRVGKVLEVADHPNADKLLVLKVDLGAEQRQIIAGIRGHYAAEGLIGREVVVVANLAPRKMRGLESQGMILAASDKSGEPIKVVVLSVEKEVPPGSSVS